MTEVSIQLRLILDIILIAVLRVGEQRSAVLNHNMLGGIEHAERTGEGEIPFIGGVRIIGERDFISLAVAVSLCYEL